MCPFAFLENWQLKRFQKHNIREYVIIIQSSESHTISIPVLYFAEHFVESVITNLTSPQRMMLQETRIKIPIRVHEFCVGHSFFHLIFSRTHTEVNTVRKSQYCCSYITPRKKKERRKK